MIQRAVEVIGLIPGGKTTVLTPPEPIRRCRQQPEQQQTQAKPKHSH